MAELVLRHRLQVEPAGGTQDEAGRRVEVYVAGDGVVVDRRRHVGPGQAAVAEVVAADANVAEAGIALLPRQPCSQNRPGTGRTTTGENVPDAHCCTPQKELRSTESRTLIHPTLELHASPNN